MTGQWSGWIGWPALPEEEQDPTVEDLKQRAASLRGEPSTKQERDAELVDLMHTSEGEGEEPSDDTEAFVRQLFAPKRGEEDWIRRLHGGEDDG